MKRLVIGTAGHIDHGKTALVQALTGVDTDRLKEEKARGITIELGFAPLELADGQKVAFVDVPGHERFIRQMVAGAFGIDAVLLVIAADEGVMPQTREHLDILHLLGIRHGAVVLSKTDLVDEELLELAIDDVRELCSGTFLSDAPVLPVSSVSKDGIPQLLDLINNFHKTLQERPADGDFRLPIDRVFTMKGFGSVVTGTALAGHLAVGATIEIVPSGQKARVRGIQVHGEGQREVFAGQRAAINIQGVERDKIRRGDQLSAPGTLQATSILDVHYHHLPSLSTALRHRDRIRFLSGTSEINGVAHVLSGDEIQPGSSGFLQLRMDEPVPIRSGDRFILRLETPMTTLGGGEVLDSAPNKHRRRGRLEAASRLERLLSPDPVQVVQGWLEIIGAAGISVEALARRSGKALEPLREALLASASAGHAVLLDDEGQELVSAVHLAACRERIVETLEAFHRSFPLRNGTTRGELLNSQPFVGEKVFARALADLLNEKVIRREGAHHRISAFEATLDAGDSELAEKLTEWIESAGLAPPLMTELEEKLDADESRLIDLLDYLSRRGTLEKVKEGHWISARSIAELQTRLTDYFLENEELTPIAFKEMTGLSRKWAIPLLEYFDKIQLTLRVGDTRRLRRE